MRKKKEIPLEVVMEAIEGADDAFLYFLDLETMESVLIGQEFAVDGQEETVALIEDNPDRFLRLPTKYEIHEYSIMEDFIDSLTPGETQDRLYRAIRGRGAFRRFKDEIRYYGVEQQWYAFRDGAYRRIAIDWCRDNELDYTDNGSAPLIIEVLSQNFSVCKVRDYSQVDIGKPFCFTGATDAENSLVCETQYTPANTIEHEDNWRAFRIKGTLDFSLIGILAKISTTLAVCEIGIFAVSTYNTDYIFTKGDDFDNAIAALEIAGYRIAEAE